MHYRHLPVDALRVGDQDLGAAILTLQRDDPLPGVRGLKSWRLSGELEGPSELPDDAEISALLRDARVLTGRALLTGHRISVERGSASVAYEYRGTGPLSGATEEDYD